ncbi:hypothetical protein CK203_062888 [Vitis vinifera]|uniref:Uncharacterized protein n=1 Tax=Vitis vinifera TaxID=29760 RepID=A0A438FQZ4_VITVI|nr:hypothetical protein CK203_062888 [Vitis vinifera]
MEGEKKAFVDVAREPVRRIGDALWLQFGGRELRGVKVLKLGGAFFLLEIEDEEAERVLKRGMCRYKDKLLHLERWSEEAGCLCLGSSAKEVWVRVVGLPLHCWSGEVFKKIGDCCGVQLWWEVSLWISIVVPRNKLKGREGEKVREEWDVGSRAGNNGGMGKDIWCATEVDGAGSVRKNRGEEKGDGDGTIVFVDGFSSSGKGTREKGSGGAQGNIGLFCEGPSNLLSPRMDCALKENERSEPKSFWEVGESSKGAEWVLDPVRAQGNTSLFCEGPTNFGLGCALKENKRSGPKLFWEVGQSSKGVERVSDPNQAFLDEPLKKANACLMDEASRHSFVSPSFVCVWGGQDSSSSPFSRVERALIERKKGVFEKGDGGSFPIREGRDGRVEEEGGDVESWSYSCLENFCHCLGMPTEEFEGKILKLLDRMRERRDRFKRGVTDGGDGGGQIFQSLVASRIVRMVFAGFSQESGDFNMIRFHLSVVEEVVCPGNEEILRGG